MWLLQRAARPLREAAKRASEERISTLNEETARLTAAAKGFESQIAEAKARAAEAEEKAEAERLARAKIEARMAPRRLSLEQVRALVAGLRQFAGERFWVVTQTDDRDPGSEQMVFSSQLSAILIEAGWIKETYERGWKMTKAPLPLFRRVTARGVEVGYPEGSARAVKAAQEIAAGLTAANIDNATAVAFSDLLSGIVIDVGLR